MTGSEKDQWKLLQQGDERAWRVLFEQHYAVLCHFARQFVHDRFVAEALVGDVLFTLWEKRVELQIQGPLRPYLIQAVRNRCLNHLKSFNSKHMNPFSSVGEEYLEQLMLEDYEGRLLELEEEVQRAVSQLPEHSRVVFEKSREGNLKYEEIARELGISVNTVKFHMKKALSLLRATLAKYLVLLPFVSFLFRR